MKPSDSMRKEAPLTTITLSPIDERRFGVRTARAMDVTVGDLPELFRFCRDEEVQWLVVRCSTGDHETVCALEKTGFFLTDTLVYFRYDLERKGIPPPPKHFIRAAEEKDEEMIGRIARRVFTGYAGHYHADPRLDREACDAVYVDWAIRSWRDRELADHVLIVEVQEKMAGFLSLKRLPEGMVDGRLFAVLLEYRGQGIGQALLVGGLHWTRDQGLPAMIISTQITNIASQISCIRVGFEPYRSYYTFHRWFDGETPSFPS